MKQNYVIGIKNAGLFLFIILMCITKAEAQPLPHMYVDASTANERRDCFLKGTNSSHGSKFQLLANDLNPATETKSEICKIDPLITFLDSLTNITFLRFYFAAYKDSSNCSVIAGADIQKHLTLIIAPAIGNCNRNAIDRGDYYYIKDDGIISNIDKDCKKDWIDYYENQKLNKILSKTIDHSNSDNEDHQHNPNKYSDTKYVVYYLPYFIEFVKTERDIQQHHKPIISLTGIEIDFCSFTKQGIKLSDGQMHFKDRLSIQFEYLVTDSNGQYQIARIETTGRTPQKITDPCLGLIIDNGKHNITGDNGTLCPANCPQ